MISKDGKQISKVVNEYGVTIVENIVRYSTVNGAEYTMEKVVIQGNGKSFTSCGKFFKNKKSFCKWYDIDECELNF